MHFLPQQLVGVDRATLLILVADRDDALHREILGDTQSLAHDVLGGGAVGRKAVADLNPAGAKSQLRGLELHEGSRDGSIFYEAVALRGIHSHDNGKGAGGDRLGAEILAGGKAVESRAILDNDKLPGAFALR